MNWRMMALPLCVLALPACSKSAPAGTEKSPEQTATLAASKPLGDVLAGTPAFSTTARAVKDTGLAGVFGGKAHYTLLAPTDAAFASLGDKAAALQRPEQRAAMAALLRAHIIPGDVTADDIGKALDRAKGQPVRLHAMDKSTLSLARDGGKIVVTAPDGARAALTGDGVKARNGGVIGLDGVLKKLT